MNRSDSKILTKSGSYNFNHTDENPISNDTGPKRNISDNNDINQKCLQEIREVLKPKQIDNKQAESANITDSNDSTNDKIIRQLDKLQENLKEVRLQVDNFVGSETSDEFFDLDEYLIESSIKLDKYRFEKDSELRKRKREMLKEVNHLNDLLDSRVKDTEFVKELEQKIREIIEKIQAGSESIGDEQDKRLEDELKVLKTRITDGNFNEKLDLKKKSLLLYIERPQEQN